MSIAELTITWTAAPLLLVDELPAADPDEDEPFEVLLPLALLPDACEGKGS